MSVTSWMSWEGGVDLVAVTSADQPMPNIIVHVARMVHTPVGSAPAGMILVPGPDGAPLVMGFVSTDAKVAAYFGPNVFAGTPFEQAPTLEATIEISADSTAVVKVAGHTIKVVLGGFGPLTAANRPAGALPFDDRSVEKVASQATLTVDGKAVAFILPPTGMNGGAPAVFSATGIYSR